jgi:hypothetical protein
LLLDYQYHSLQPSFKPDLIACQLLTATNLSFLAVPFIFLSNQEGKNGFCSGTRAKVLLAPPCFMDETLAG